MGKVHQASIRFRHPVWIDPRRTNKTPKKSVLLDRKGSRTNPSRQERKRSAGFKGTNRHFIKTDETFASTLAAKIARKSPDFEVKIDQTKMSHYTCCVVNCKNTGPKSGRQFYRFPIAKYKILQRNQWIAAVRRKNLDGSPWYPKPWDTICSEHFVGNTKSELQSSPSYNPTIFPSVYKAKVGNGDEARKRHERFMKRRIIKQEPIIPKGLQRVTNMEQSAPDRDNNHTSINSSTSDQDISVGKKTCDQGCQTNILSFDHIYQENTFICNRYITSGASCNDVEIQTEIVISSGLTTVPNRKQFKDKNRKILIVKRSRS